MPAHHQRAADVRNALHRRARRRLCVATHVVGVGSPRIVAGRGRGGGRGGLARPSGVPVGVSRPHLHGVAGAGPQVEDVGRVVPGPELDGDAGLRGVEPGDIVLGERPLLPLPAHRGDAVPRLVGGRRPAARRRRDGEAQVPRPAGHGLGTEPGRRIGGTQVGGDRLRPGRDAIRGTGADLELVRIPLVEPAAHVEGPIRQPA